MKNRVLITGAAGYIGSRLVPFLQSHFPGISLVTLDKTSGFDLAVREKTIGAIRRFQPDVLIHLATHSALAYQNRSVESATEDSKVLSHIFEGLETFSECRLLYMSTSYVYSGLSSRQRVSEESGLKPSHPFGVWKAHFEDLILKHHLNSVIFRLFSVFGPGNYFFPNSVHTMVRECLEKKTVTVWGEGQRRMQYVFIGDVLKCLVKGLTMPPGIYNVGGDEYLTTAETAEKIAEVFGGDVIFFKTKKEGATLPFGDNSKIKRTCDVAFTPFDQALESYQK